MITATTSGDTGTQFTVDDFAVLLTDGAAAALEALLPPRTADGAAPRPGEGAPNAVEADAWVSALVRARNTLDSLLAQAVQVAKDAGIEDRFRSGSDTRYLKRRHHLSDHAARELLTATAFTGTSRGVDDDIHRCLPGTLAAFRTGRISAAHIAVIADAVGRIPVTRTEEVAEVFERALVQYSRSTAPHAVKAEAGAFLDVIGAEATTDRDRRIRRGLFLGRQHTDGMSYLHGWLTPQARAWFETMTKILGQPGLNNIDDMYSPRGTLGGDPVPGGAAGPSTPGTEAGPATADRPAESEPSPRHGVDPDEVAAAAERDERSNSQRAHDAFAAACEYAAASGALGRTFRGLPAHLIITVSLEQLESACGRALTATGTHMSVTEMLTCAELVHPALVVFDHDGQPLHLGRGRRTASLNQRLALFARDRGCTRPGCDHGAFGTEVHHLIAWAAGGLTDVPNLALACKRDHRNITDTATGLTAWMGPDGRPVWTSNAPDPNHPDAAAPAANGRHRPGEDLARAFAQEATASGLVPAAPDISASDTVAPDTGGAEPTTKKTTRYRSRGTGHQRGPGIGHRRRRAPASPTDPHPTG